MAAAEVWVDRDIGILYVRLAEPERDRQIQRTSNYLGKFGVNTDWDGHGTLLGLEIKVGPDVRLQVEPYH